MKLIEKSAESRADIERTPGYANKAEIVMCPNISRPVYDALLRGFDVESLDELDPSDERQMAALDRLEQINAQQETIRNYCDVELNDAAYDAAALGSVMDMYISGRGKKNANVPWRRAERILADYFANRPDGDDSQDSIYIAGLLRDRERLQELKRTMPNDSIMVDPDYDRPTRDEWLKNPQIADAETLASAIDTINIESFLISGAELLTKFNQPQTDLNSVDTLRDVRFAEQIVAPVAEVIGYDTLAMSLNDRTKQIRLDNGGRRDLIYRAKDALNRYSVYNRKHDIARNTVAIFDDIVGGLLDVSQDELAAKMPVGYGLGNPSVYGDTNEVSMNIGNNEQVSASWRFRLKTTGSLAWKMYRAEQSSREINAMPMDMLGITAITNSEEDQAKLFSALVRSLYANSDFDPHPSPSKDSPVHVRGTTEFIGRMTAGLDGQYALDLKEAKSQSALHLGRVTAFYNTEAGNAVPFEIQCVTRQYRDAMQTGELAHIIYKTKVDKDKSSLSSEQIEQWTALLRDLRQRRGNIGWSGLVGTEWNDGSPIPGDSGKDAREFLAKLRDDRETISRTVGFFAVGAPLDSVRSI